MINDIKKQLLALLENDRDLLTERQPDTIADTKQTIIQQLDAIQEQRDQLTDELLRSYNHLNAAFEATINIASCQDIDKAVSIMVNEIARAIGYSFAFYVGPLAMTGDIFDNNILSQSNIATGSDNKIYDDNEATNESSNKSFPPKSKSKTGTTNTANRKSDNAPLIIASDVSHKKTALNFWQHQKTHLLDLASKTTDTLVTMIDYHRPHIDDYDGRGNVLLLRLGGNHEELQQSILIFVRGDELEPFDAVQMNLAATLARMAAAVLGNIIYAQKLNQAYLQTITSLVKAMEAKDPYTSGHSTRVAEFACKLAKHLNLDRHQIKLLQWAGLLHDIGKIGIHEDILCKPGRLTDKEFEHIKTHPVKSYMVLEPIAALKEILPAVKHHHEHYAGNGYPDKLKGEAIPYLARILQIADVWDAITSTRSYRPALPTEKAQNILRKEAGTTMDPKLVESFLDMLGQTKP